MKLSLNTLSPFFLPLLLILLMACRLGNLNLPFFWDEAWSYANAVFNMHDNGLALLPGRTNVELTRGHPLLFYFAAAAWSRLFGTTLIAMHLFALLVSTLLLIATYYVANEFFDKYTAMAATLLFSLQSIFLAQSTMLLPEVMLSLWTLLTVLFYFRKKWELFIVFSILLVMTKETGIILIAALIFDKIILERFFSDNIGKSRYLRYKETGFVSIPAIVFASFITIQKLKFGWFFYPEHTDLIIKDASEILNGFRIYFSRLFFQHGRNILFVASMVTLTFAIYKKTISRKQAHILLFSTVFVLFYITFSSVNFFTRRYLLSVLPFFIIPGSWLILSLPVKKWIITALIGMLALLFSFHTFVGNQKETDTSLGYKNTVELHKLAINFIEEMQDPHLQVYSYYLMNYYMTYPRLGYLNNKTSFYEFKPMSDPSCSLFIFCSNEKDPAYPAITQNDSFILFKRFEKKQAWVEIYIRKEPNAI